MFTKNELTIYTLFLILTTVILRFMGLRICDGEYELILPSLVAVSSMVLHITSFGIDYIKQREYYRKLSTYHLIGCIPLFIYVVFDYNIYSLMSLALCFVLYHVYLMRGNRLIIPQHMYDLIEDKNMIYVNVINEVVYKYIFKYGNSGSDVWDYFSVVVDTEYLTDEEIEESKQLIIDCLEPYCDSVEISHEKNIDENLYVTLIYNNLASNINNFKKLKDEIEQRERTL